jgi:CHAD domain-containing protein
VRLAARVRSCGACTFGKNFVKPQRVDFSGVRRIEQLTDRIVKTRAGEVRAQTGALQQREMSGLHDFRIACKRLRYAIERFHKGDPVFEPIGEGLALLQDALGEAHDRDVLLAILPPSMPETERRLRTEREASIDRAMTVWQKVEQWMRALDSHRI